LSREFFTCSAVVLARKLIGTILAHKYGGKTIKCKIVETEAYMGAIDSACHAYKNKKTERTKYMFKEGGHLYVFSIYGHTNCLNITASRDGNPEAVLIRAVEPLEGIEVIKKNRQIKSKHDRDLTNGPGKLT
jgi:DNA-3-methyladenine glycosylase